MLRDSRVKYNINSKSYNNFYFAVVLFLNIRDQNEVRNRVLDNIKIVEIIMIL